MYHIFFMYASVDGRSGCCSWEFLTGVCVKAGKKCLRRWDHVLLNIVSLAS